MIPIVYACSALFFAGVSLFAYSRQHSPELRKCPHCPSVLYERPYWPARCPDCHSFVWFGS